VNAQVPKVQITGVSDIGIVREENQDALLIHEPEDPETLASKGIFVALADGMGGLEEGSLASRLAVDAAKDAYYSDASSPPASLEKAVRAANAAIYRHSQEIQGGRQMGSTLTALAIVSGKAFVAQVGDSRAYRYRRGTISQITRDHSLIRELIDRGDLDESAAIFNPHRNILTRGLGLRDEVAGDVYEVGDLETGDTILLSSDGLHGLVQEDELASCLERFGSNLAAACQELVRVARDRGGPDNITVAIAQVEEIAPLPGASRRRAGRPGELGGWLLPILVFLSFASGVLLTLALQGFSPEAGPKIQRARELAEEALKRDGDAVNELERASDLREALERIHEAIESDTRSPPERE
jgi:protein phosphatase